MKNEFEIIQDYVKIYYGKDNVHTIIDLEDLHLLEDVSYVEPTGKTLTPLAVFWKNRKKKRILLYRYILNAPKGFDVDHKDGNTRNNRKSNLRIATKAENAQNKLGANKNSKSGMLNIYHDPTRKKCWLVQIKKDSKIAYRERFESLEEAIKIRDLKRAELFPFSQEALTWQGK